MTTKADQPYRINNEDLMKMFRIRNGNLAQASPAARRWLRFGYFPTADHYEVLIDKLVTEHTVWLDVGGGHSLFPYSPPLSEQLSKRAKRIVGVDPSENIEKNPYVHEFKKCTLEDFVTDRQFDLVTFRMVAEHIAQPEQVLEKVNRLLAPGGKIVVYTPHFWAPSTLISHVLPFRFHHAIKNFFWQTEEEDTFPTVYRMNTRKRLRQLFEGIGCTENFFMYLDDQSKLMRFAWLHYMELAFWYGLRVIRLRSPDVVLAVYEKAYGE